MYNSTKEDFVIVPIKKIIIDKSIIEAVKKYGGEVPKGILVDKKFSSPLNRMEEIKDYKGGVIISSPYKAVLNGIPLPPVILKPYGKTGFYTIFEGRHRIASSIIRGYQYVPADIIV